MATTAKKLTKKDRFIMLRDMVEAYNPAGADDMLVFIDEQIALLDRKRTSKKPTANQIANMELADTLLSVLSDTPMTIADICASHADFKGFTPQKMTSLLRPLIDSGKVEKTMKNKKAHFALVAVGE